MRGFKTLKVGMKVPVRLINTDSVHGFIDFEYDNPAETAKRERLERKRAAARRLRGRVGDLFDAWVTGVSEKATWIQTMDGIEGRLVRGWRGLSEGDKVSAILLSADPVNGFIDFANERSVLPLS
jgi:hypothetical protein